MEKKLEMPEAEPTHEKNDTEWSEGENAEGTQHEMKAEKEGALSDADEKEERKRRLEDPTRWRDVDR